MFVCNKSWEELNKENKELKEELNETKLKLEEYRQKYTAQITCNCGVGS